jgi:hypothetical protein
MVIDGDFTKLKLTHHEKTMLDDAYKAVSITKMWNYIRNKDFNENGFMFCTDDELSKISAAMAYQGHSGASFAWVMRQMEYIAKDGWTMFVSIAGHEEGF